jgi:hypothetical protein
MQPSPPGLGEAGAHRKEGVAVIEMATVLASSSNPLLFAPFWILLVIIAVIATLGFAFGGRK